VTVLGNTGGASLLLQPVWMVQMRERKTVRIGKRSEAGFTLIEMMIATVVLSVGLLGLAPRLPTA